MKIDSISKALETEHGFDLTSGKYIKVNESHNMSNELIHANKYINDEMDEIEDSYSDEYEKDEDNVKRNIRELIDKGMDIADEMFELVRMSESPKSFEPAANFLKTIVELNEKLLDVHERRMKREKPAKGNGSGTTNNTTNVQQNIVAMDPSKMLELIGNKK